uniref:Piwi domain-containing protein n=1 Tax=Syphacia muris TaxID=451379 RepID=A0A158R3Z7_9BILA
MSAKDKCGRSRGSGKASSSSADSSRSTAFGGDDLYKCGLAIKKGATSDIVEGECKENEPSSKELSEKQIRGKSAPVTKSGLNCSRSENLSVTGQTKSSCVAGSLRKTPRRLKKAELKNAVAVISNFYPLVSKDVVIFKYGVNISLDLKRSSNRISSRCLTEGQSGWKRPLCNEILKYTLETLHGLNSIDYVYDGGNVLFTRMRLELEKLVNYVMRREVLPAYVQSFVRNEETINVSVSESEGVENGFRLHDIDSSINADINAQDRSLRQFYEILTTQGAIRNGTHYVLGSGKVFLKDGGESHSSTVMLGDGKKVLSGAEKSVRFIENNGMPVPALVIDAKRAAFFGNQSLMSLVKEVWKQPIEAVDENCFEEFVDCVGPVIAGLRLRNILHGSMFSATGLSSKCVADIEITVNKNRTFTLTQMYRNLEQPIKRNLPAVVYKSKGNEAYFPIEILSVCAGQRVPLWKQSKKSGAKMIKYCSVDPLRHFNEIEKCLENLELYSGTGNAVLQAFGVEVSGEPIKVDANRRDAPSVVFGTGKVSVDKDTASWESRKIRYECPAKIGRLLFCFDKTEVADSIKNFARILMEKAIEKGIEISGFDFYHVTIDKLETFFEEVVSRLERPSVIYIDSQEDTHDELKLMETLKQVITQHVSLNTALQCTANSRTMENIINKMNCKNHGLCYRLLPEDCLLSKWITSGDTLVIGYDVCHPDPDSAFQRRVGSSTINPSFSFNGAKHPEVFIGDYAYQEPRKEQVGDDILDERARWMLKAFYVNRRKLPRNVIITRDGVSESQFAVVRNFWILIGHCCLFIPLSLKVRTNEMETIRSAMKDFANVALGDSKYNPRFTLILATKRHNKRFAMINAEGKCCNALPGTVIDHTITRPDADEFFLQSHRVIRGTGKIPGYVMLANEIGLTMDEVQSLMLTLCFSHQIVFSAVSIPEPIFQADEWAKRGRNVFRAMVKRTHGKVPRKRNMEISWKHVTRKLCYMNKRLASTRANA